MNLCNVILGVPKSAFVCRDNFGSSELAKQSSVTDEGFYRIWGFTNQGSAYQADGILIVGNGGRLKIASNGKLGTIVNGSWRDI